MKKMVNSKVQNSMENEKKTIDCESCGYIYPTTEKECKYCGAGNHLYTGNQAKTGILSNFIPQAPVYGGGVPFRPQLHPDLVLWLIVLYVIPGLLYILYIGNQQKQWDERYGNTEIGRFYIANPRPVMCYTLAVVLFILLLLPGFIYVIVKRGKIKRWYKGLNSKNSYLVSNSPLIK